MFCRFAGSLEVVIFALLNISHLISNCTIKVQQKILCRNVGVSDGGQLEVIVIALYEV